MTKHFYIYNECNVAIASKANFLDSNGKKLSHSQRIAPGEQRMLAYTDKNPVEHEAVSVDGRLHWGLQSFDLSAREYTHVVACGCAPGKNDCPATWPFETSRQLPEKIEAAFDVSSMDTPALLSVRPEIDELKPQTVEQNWDGTLTLSGANFTEGGWVIVDGKFFDAEYVDESMLKTVINATVTSSPGDKPVKIHTALGKLSNTKTLTVA